MDGTSEFLFGLDVNLLAKMCMKSNESSLLLFFNRPNQPLFHVFCFFLYFCSICTDHTISIQTFRTQ